MDEIIKQATNVGIFAVAFFVLLRYFLQRMEKQIEKGEQREEGYRDEVKRGAEREVKLQEVITENQIIIKDNQEIMRKQADSIGEIKEIKAILKIKGDVQ
ncbi:TPA: BhlA/UviB family holin-like peptide [Bacillus cereus]